MNKGAHPNLNQGAGALRSGGVACQVVQGACGVPHLGVGGPADEWKYKPTPPPGGSTTEQCWTNSSLSVSRALLSGVFWRTTALSASDGRVVDCHGVDGSGGLGFDSGEGAWEMATTSTEGSRRANCPMPKRLMMRQRKEIGAPNALCVWGYQWGIFRTIQHRVTIGGQVWCQHPR